MIALFVAGAALLGLAIFAMLVRNEPEPAFFRVIGVMVVLLGLAGFGLLRLLPNESGAGAGRLVFSLALLWVAWIGLLAFVVQALRLRFPQSADWLLLSAGLATLAPVTGMVVALWMM